MSTWGRSPARSDGGRGPPPHPSPASGGGRRMPRGLRLRHAAGAAPALERGPDRALEPEAVDRRRAFQRTDAIEPDPGPLEAAFLQHPPRSRIGDAGTGLQRLELEIGEGVVDQRARRLGGEAAAPVRHAEPAAELRHQARSTRPVAQLEPARADERALGERDHERRLPVRPVGRGQERFGIRERIGMRDARRVLGDAALVAENRDVLGVLGTRRAQHQALGLEDGNTRLPQALRGDRVQQRHGTGSFAPKKRRGKPASRLPSWNPIGSAGSMDAGGRTNFRRLVCHGLRHRDHGYVGAAFGLGLELDSPVGQCEQRVILADAHVLAGVPFGAALARKDIAGEHRLAAEQFHAQATARRIPAVARGTACFLVSHEFAALLSSIFYPDSVTESYHFFFHFFFPLPLSAAGFFAAGFFVGAAGFSALVWRLPSSPVSPPPWAWRVLLPPSPRAPAAWLRPSRPALSAWPPLAAPAGRRQVPRASARRGRRARAGAPVRAARRARLAARLRSAARLR